MNEYPTISITPLEFEDGTYGVCLMVTGLVSLGKANVVMDHMEQMFCGAEIKEST